MRCIQNCDINTGTESSGAGVLCRHSGKERKQDSRIQQAPAGGGQGTADDRELLSPFTGGRQQNSHGCQTVLARRDAPADDIGLCPYKKNPRFRREGSYYAYVRNET